MGCGCGGSYHPAQPCDIYHRPAAMDIDYGTPVDALCKETSAGVFRREWSKATVEVDCNRFSSEIRMKSDDGALRIVRWGSADVASLQGRTIRLRFTLTMAKLYSFQFR